METVWLYLSAVRSLKYIFPLRVHIVSSIRVFENGDFFRRSPPHVNDVFGDQKRKFSKKVPAWSFFKALFLCGRTKMEVFEYDGYMMSYIIQRMPCNACYRISIALPFSSGRVKTIPIRYV